MLRFQLKQNWAFWWSSINFTCLFLITWPILDMFMSMRQPLKVLNSLISHGIRILNKLIPKHSHWTVLLCYYNYPRDLSILGISQDWGVVNSQCKGCCLKTISWYFGKKYQKLGLLKGKLKTLISFQPPPILKLLYFHWQWYALPYALLAICIIILDISLIVFNVFFRTIAIIL